MSAPGESMAGVGRRAALIVHGRRGAPGLVGPRLLDHAEKLLELWRLRV